MWLVKEIWFKTRIRESIFPMEKYNKNMKAKEEDEEEGKAGIIVPAVYTMQCIALVKCDNACL